MQIDANYEDAYWVLSILQVNGNRLIHLGDQKDR